LEIDSTNLTAVSAESAPQNSPAFDPQTWVDLLTVHGLKGDMFSTRTLTVIHEGVEALATARASNPDWVAIVRAHVSLFERLHRAFNNPNLLKEVGIVYLQDFSLPGIAQKHFELAHQLAPKDRDIEQLQVEAALAVARQMTDKSGHSGLDEAAPSKAGVGDLLRKTVKLAHIVNTRTDLGESAGQTGQKQEDRRKAEGARPQQNGSAPAYIKLLKRVQALIYQTDFSGASMTLKEAQDEGAPNGELEAYYAQLGLAAYDHGRMEESLSAFSRMRDLAPKSVEGWFNCGLVYQKMGHLDEALTAYEEAVRIAPENPKTWCNLSSVWFERGNFAEAEKAARRTIELKPDYARAWDNLASALSALNRLPEAAEACQQAIRIQPALHSAWFKYGVVNFQMNNMFLAVEAFNMTGDNADFFPFVLYYMSMIESRRGDIELAIEKLQEARAADPHNELEITALKEMAIAFGKAGDHSRAAEGYTEITQKRPDDFSAWLALGTACHRAEKRDQAREAYRHAATLRLDSPLPWHNLGLLASDLGQREEARKCFEREVELAPEDAKAWYDLGVAYKALGLDVESAEAFEKAEDLVKTLTRRSSDLSAAMSIVRRLNLGERRLKTE
jgi:tetratricopeptide (TPR) repeat protein